MVQERLFTEGNNQPKGLNVNGLAKIKIISLWNESRRGCHKIQLKSLL